MGSLAMTGLPLGRRPTIAGARLRTLGWTSCDERQVRPDNHRATRWPGLGTVARGAPRFLARRLAEDRQEGRARGDRRPSAGARAGDPLRLDRRPEAGI